MSKAGRRTTGLAMVPQSQYSLMIACSAPDVHVVALMART